MSGGRIRPNDDPYTELTLQIGEVIRLASLIEEVANLDQSEATVCSEALVNGCGAVARVIVEKVQAIEGLAGAMKGGK